MPDRRLHRGPHPEDAKLFNAETLPLLRGAVADASWLLSRGYADKSTLKLVGDRYNLNVRQRLAVMRASCSDEQRQSRPQKEVSAANASGQPLMIDGYNLLITLESALAGGLLFVCRDGCVRDLASLHGTYRKVEETLPALELALGSLRELGINEMTWLLDRPIANSGRLKSLILQTARAMDLACDVELVPNPDKQLIAAEGLIATSDSAVLDACRQWLNLARLIISGLNPPFLLDLNV
ncbi:MAG: DUF434 domain-containing protein [Planctomycetaceae bacterium]|nr:DUF434 domain-containing protein [Planctomycetaceae bacterium]